VRCRGSAGGLLLFDRGYEGGNVLIHRDIPPPYVCNPYTGKFLQLPGMLGATWIQLRCIAEDNNGACKVVVKDAMNKLRGKELVAERELNLSMAPSGGACELVTDVSCVDAQDGRHFMEKPSDCILAADPSLQSDCQLDNTPVDDNVDMFDKIESSPDCKQEKEPAEDNLEAIDGTKGNSSGPETNYENLYLVQKGSPSALASDQHLIKTVNEDNIVDDASAATIRDIDAYVILEALRLDWTSSLQRMPQKLPMAVTLSLMVMMMNMNLFRILKRSSTNTLIMVILMVEMLMNRHGSE
jgi:hypothetical protein